MLFTKRHFRVKQRLISNWWIIKHKNESMEFFSNTSRLDSRGDVLPYIILVWYKVHFSVEVFPLITVTSPRYTSDQLPILQCVNTYVVTTVGRNDAKIGSDLCFYGVMDYRIMKRINAPIVAGIINWAMTHHNHQFSSSNRVLIIIQIEWLIMGLIDKLSWVQGRGSRSRNQRAAYR
jgi:hypothetical protein